MTTISGLKILTRFADAHAEPGADPPQGRLGPPVATPCRRDDVLDVVRAVDGVQQHVLADLRLPAADRAAPADPSSGVDAHVPDLAGVAARAGQRTAVEDDPAADADLAGQVHEVLHADSSAPGLLGNGAEVGVVADHDRRREAQRITQGLAERNLDPAEVRREVHQPVAVAHHPRHRDCRPDPRPAGRCRSQQRLRHRPQLLHSAAGLNVLRRC